MKCAVLGVVACTRHVMSSNRRPFDDHGFGQELRDLASAYLDLYGPDSSEFLVPKPLRLMCFIFLSQQRVQHFNF